MKSVLDFRWAHRKGEKITMVTSYDAWSARLIADSPVDCILVGDSASMVMHGAESTLGADLDMMEMHVRAVKRGAPQTFIVGDMPFLSHRKGLESAMTAVERLSRAGASAVKLEGADGHLDIVQHIVESGIPVMGHLGLTPQFIHGLGGYRVQGKTDEDARRLMNQAKGLEASGCFAIVLECIPEQIATNITESVSIPTIGIGSGPGTSGQVLVLQDMLGLSKDFNPVFVRKYLDGASLVGGALAQFAADVKQSAFPTLDESYMS